MEIICSSVAVRIFLQRIWFQDNFLIKSSEHDALLFPVGNSAKMMIRLVASAETDLCGGTEALKQEIVVGCSKDVKISHARGSEFLTVDSPCMHL